MSMKDAIKSVTRGMPTLVTGGKPGYRAGDEKLAWNDPRFAGPEIISIRSDAFADGSAIPSKYSADGEEISPPLTWTGVPSETQSLVLIVEDPDAPTPNPYVHWLLYNIPTGIARLDEGVKKEEVATTAGGAMQGKNSGLKIGWAGMAPPKGDSPHRYFFQLFALNERLSLDAGAGRTALFEALAGRVIGRGRIVGTYQR